jgi:membrane-bound lytic murein transglycosylase MltF
LTAGRGGVRSRLPRRVSAAAVRFGLVLLASLLLTSALPAQGPVRRYDPTFRKYSKRFFGAGFDWRLFKAQGMTESNLNPEAKSRVGARGIMQLMPSTFLDIQSRNPAFATIDNTEWNIAAGIYYDRRLWLQWREDSVASEDHHHFMFASYNAGRIPILKAQAIARQQTLDPRLWSSIELVAREVPGWRHRETLDYLRRINENLGRMNSKGHIVGSVPSTVSTDR